MLDDLVFTLDGNCINNITDYAVPADLYNTKEYHDLAVADDIQQMMYDANGNLTRDLDRTIDTIRYNMYNLPDTVIFANGNKIINHYNASGNKWKTEYHTIIDAMYLPNTADGIVFEGNLADIHYTIYDGNIEYKYIVNSMGVDSLYEYVIHNTEGYIAYHPQNNTMTHYYYHQDHLGNICAVWDATHDSIVQQTLYYASGLPVSVSTGQDVQPYKYNGKEYVEMHGYDVYEYGARGYYATIGRFTSIDPLCEQTPWQSPYVYANNNWVNNIDWMGMSADGFHIPTLNWVAVDKDGNVQGFDLLSDDKHVYLVDDSWDGTYKDLSPDDIIGWQIPGWTDYTIGKPCYYIGINADIFSFNECLMYGNKKSFKTINSTIAALLHYFKGNGIDAQNGLWALLCFMNTSAFMNILYEVYVLGDTSMSGCVDMEFFLTQFHIGDTSYSYYTTGNSLIIGYGLNDGFWDANFIFEFLGKFIDKPEWKPDRTGPNLEVPNGTPYPYAPSYIILPL